ncbi:alpha/beta hydrolase [Pseudothauera nasutitermitis]|uniref:Alpha/beta hydrolase n=1 Tax=Pseudothauera nasutitermitis TaxID=2565930 RepID=A0A4S4AY05_9RHOO|nr:alpha/beta hydrolase-fold protein [Pseudothauera nasutitermitis]THF64516.1 alpha/beta hydrolase [Pseudothauera nasutitermitis]
MNGAAALPVALRGTQVRSVRSAAGIDYHLCVWVPPGTPPAGGWPVVYALDGNAVFGTFVEGIRRSSRRPDATGVAPAAVVGIAQSGEHLFSPDALRQRDFSPQDKGGGAEAFLAFLADELAPALAGELSLNPARQTLFGHSLAGFFVLHALTQRPAAFQNFAAISPSVWWDEAGLRARLPALAGADARVFVAAGEWEDEVPPWQRPFPGYEELVQRRAQCRMVGNARDIAAELGALLGEERVRFQFFADEDHASILMIGIQRVLRFALAPTPAELPRP